MVAFWTFPEQNSDFFPLVQPDITLKCVLVITPDALVLAILCDFKARPAKDIIHYILTRLKTFILIWYSVIFFDSDE